MVDKLSFRYHHFSLSTSILCVLFAVGCFYPGTSQGQSWELVEKELTQYTLSPAFERIIQQFVQEGEETFYKDGPAAMALDILRLSRAIPAQYEQRHRGVIHRFEEQIKGAQWAIETSA